MLSSVPSPVRLASSFTSGVDPDSDTDARDAALLLLASETYQGSGEGPSEIGLAKPEDSASEDNQDSEIPLEIALKVL